MGDLSCDICGRKDVRAIIRIEGAKMLACGSCVRSGTVIHWLTDDDADGPAVVEARPKAPLGETREIIEGYGRRIKTARDKTRLPIAVIAERIREKESYLDAIENERIMPSFAVARKLEKELKIKLIEEVDQSVGASTAASSGKFTEPTLADMLLSQKKKKKES